MWSGILVVVNESLIDIIYAMKATASTISLLLVVAQIITCHSFSITRGSYTSFGTSSRREQRGKRNPFSNHHARNYNTPPLKAIDPMQVSEEIQVDNLQIEQLSPTTTIVVFIIGIIPFIWATYEFWRRIAVGASFGTGSDSVIIPSPFDGGDGKDGNDLITIGEDNKPTSSRGRQTLDRGALIVAYILFAAAGGSIAIAVASVVMGPQTNPL